MQSAFLLGRNAPVSAKRIGPMQPGKAGEIAVRRKKFRAIFYGQNRQMGIGDEVSRSSRFNHQGSENFPVSRFKSISFTGSLFPQLQFSDYLGILHHALKQYAPLLSLCQMGIQHPFIQKKLEPGRFGGPGIVGDHDDGLSELPVEPLHQSQDLPGPRPCPDHR